ncbi:MAG: ABC transporter substrate-binding protein [Methylophaga sp.]|nr:MAG: ABC transporter substrate-binding protein [Methylophaga sp.]
MNKKSNISLLSNYLLTAFFRYFSGIILLICLSQTFLFAVFAGDDNDTILLDQLNRPIQLDRKVERIVTIPMPAASILIGIEQGVKSLSAMHPESLTAAQRGLLYEWFPELLSLPTNVVGRGFVPNVESILKINPDLVIQWGDRGEDLIAPLEAVGLNVLAVRYGTENDTQTWLRLFGNLIGEQQRVSELIDIREVTYDRLEVLRMLPEDQKPKVLYLLRAKSGFQAAGKDTFNHYSIETAGGRNVTTEISGFKPVNTEQILAWDPDVILLNSFEKDLSPDFIIDDPLLSLTSASKDKRVYVMPIGGYRWDPPSLESPLAWLWLASLFHYESFDLDMKLETSELMMLFYGKKLEGKKAAAFFDQLSAKNATLQR